ncbi:carboxyl-terminal protease [Thermovirga lienii DSM 17291]|uniref:Carboxyl-terminal protease n=1 Tax=Thermovirga lienii (strain ATCC BAA-1197 / DSM 17291 / Cas60314) TaxID=580340 RepID=G7V6I4_THELD|nr:S41 family peptidase [Thermovirga lienii]AER67097.1 carboxyl-terminal protease [Thermovirga lienii DSM 17291]
MWKRLRDITAGIIIGAILAGGVLITFAGEGKISKSSEISELLPFSPSELWLIKQARIIMETYFVEPPEKIKEEEILYGAIRGMIKSWGDPYSRFVDPKELENEEIEMEGEYGGLGIYIAQRDGRTLIISPIEGTPAERAGVKPMDEIVKIGDEVIYGWDQDKVVKNLRGEPGTKVTIWVRREGHEDLIKFDITRELIQIHTVRHEMLDDYGYIRIIQFNQRTKSEFSSALNDVIEKGAKGIVLDLRNNPGGLLDACISVADMLIDDGIIVSTRGRFERANEVYYATPGKMTDLPIVVLVNEGSASASEILSGALKDHKRAIVMGKKTFGKGSVQTLFYLPDASGIFVTIAKYYTPNGTVIDKIGLEPNIVVEGEFEKDHDKDVQLKRAIEELNKLAVGQGVKTN